MRRFGIGHDPATGRCTLRTGGQGVHGMQAVLAESIFRLPKEKMRVIQADVGGGFGMKIWVYPEYPVCLLAARLVGRPVRWRAERIESFCPGRPCLRGRHVPGGRHRPQAGAP